MDVVSPRRQDAATSSLGAAAPVGNVDRFFVVNMNGEKRIVKSF
jgi:hypothetical protein